LLPEEDSRLGLLRESFKAQSDGHKDNDTLECLLIARWPAAGTVVAGVSFWANGLNSDQHNTTTQRESPLVGGLLG
jgi:hypothetical protein